MNWTQVFVRYETGSRADVRYLAAYLYNVAKLALLWPLAVVSVIALKLESGGPVLVRDAEGLKFRTVTEDGRVTRLGCFLHKTELDRFPSFFAG